MGVRVSIVAGMLACLLCLLWLYPNLVHEPLHIVALEMQGLSGSINFDWSFPAHPSTVAVVKPGSVAGGLLFQLLPSVVSVVLLLVIVLSRAYATVWTHFVLPAYLGFDLLVNVVSYSLPTSDFRFLQVVPWAQVWIVGLVVGLTLSALWVSRVAVSDAVGDGV